MASLYARLKYPGREPYQVVLDHIHSIRREVPAGCRIRTLQEHDAHILEVRFPYLPGDRGIAQDLRTKFQALAEFPFALGGTVTIDPGRGNREAEHFGPTPELRDAAARELPVHAGDH